MIEPTATPALHAQLRSLRTLALAAVAAAVVAGLIAAALAVALLSVGKAADKGVTTEKEAASATRLARGNRTRIIQRDRILVEKGIYRVGPRGVVGGSGPRGRRGAASTVPGSPGPRGEASTVPGPPGERGPQGEQGVGLLGPIGPVGPTGLKGADGSDGAPGANGADGKTVTQITVTFPDNTQQVLTCSDPEGDGTVACA